MTEKYTPQKADYIDLKGKKYLPARRRVQWFRGEHPDWTINTRVVDMDFAAGYAVIRAEVSDETGRLIASGMKTETKTGFGDFVEKAETGAIARAVAIAGYGTEDALDLDEGERIADGPVASRTQPEQRRGAQASSPNAAAPVQYRRAELAALMQEHHLGLDAVEVIADRLGITERPMSDESMDRLIEAIESEQAASAHAAAPSTPEADARSTAPATTAAPEDEGSPPATSSEPSSALSMDDVLAAAGPGAEEVPPLPDEDPEGYRAWFNAQPREVRADLRAKGRGPKKATAGAAS